jgi:hypothetical protein
LFQEKMYWVILEKFHKTSNFCKMFLMNEPHEADNKQTCTGILITHILFNNNNDQTPYVFEILSLLKLCIYTYRFS